MKKFFLVSLASLALSVHAQSSKVAAYVAQHKDIAQAEMQTAHIPASITLAQGIIESSCGTSRLARRSNNQFGIKVKGSNTRYKTYKNSIESFVDHSNILKNGRRYASLFNLSETDYIGWAKGLRKAKYAANRHYDKDLIACIRHYNLHQYDEQVL